MSPLNGNAKDGGRYDPAFTGNRAHPLHRWVPWVAGYSAKFVDDVLDTYNGRAVRSRVLDPFAGVGTTLVEARLHGCDTVGFELNPWPALVSRIKLAAGKELRAESLRSAVTAYRAFCASHPRAARKVPTGFKSNIPFFSPSIERKVLLTLDFIDSIDDPWTRGAFRVALGSVMVSFSNYTYEPSLGSRPGAGKALIERADVEAIIAIKAEQMAEDIQTIERAAETPDTERTVYNTSFLDYATVEAGTFDLAITSPPYLNNYHYIRNTRPQMWWLGLVSDAEAQKQVELRSMGKYWQTVRAGDPIHLTFGHDELTRTLRRLRATRTAHGVYGGRGWANYVGSYFNDTYRYLTVLYAALREGGRAVVVVGNSVVQGIPIPVEKHVAEIGKLVGFSHEATNVLRTTRVGGSILNSSVRRGTKTGVDVGLYEAAVILRRRV
ncbi:MAG: site-specific DNA-methyltransferase [Nitrososphaerota archaeon]|nr:site-specific DNA-methyltransferase [Nitrososphaerota archaeon]